MSLRYQHSLVAMNADTVFIPYLESRAKAWRDGLKVEKDSYKPLVILRDALQAGVISVIMVEAEMAAQTWDNPGRILARLICNNIRSPMCDKLLPAAAESGAQAILAQLSPPILSESLEQSKRAPLR